MPMESPGRSGAKFYSSYNRHFIVKGLGREEVALMLQIVQAYHAVSVCACVRACVACVHVY